MKNNILGHLLFRRSLFDSILEARRTRRKRLYVLQEINPRWLQMKKCFFMKNWGWDQKLEVKGYVLVQKVQFLKKRWKKEDQCTSIFHFADRPELPYEVDFWRNRFAQNIGFQICWRFWNLLRVVLGVFEEISMSLYGFWLGTVTENDEMVLIQLVVQQINLFKFKIINFTRNSRKSGCRKKLQQNI